MGKKNEHITAEGVIAQALGYENFRVTLDNGVELLATVSGRLRLHRIRLMTGDRVKVEISPYDLTRGRIVYRFNAARR